MKTLSGLLPIWASCKIIRDDKGYWNILELSIQKHSDAQFSHGMCPECSDKFYENENWYIEMKKVKMILPRYCTHIVASIMQISGGSIFVYC